MPQLLQTDSDSDTLSPSPPTLQTQLKVLLLGQSSSGKSTLQANLHLHLSPNSFSPLLPAYKPVIYLNLIAALRALFIELDYQLSTPAIASPALAASFRTLRDELAIDAIRLRLLPLLALESFLAAELADGAPVVGEHAQQHAGPFVRPGWQARLAPIWALPSRPGLPGSDLAFLCCRTLAGAVGDIQKLWTHWITRFYVGKRVVPLEDNAAYFLDHIERIGGVGYSPTSDDILRARIRTVGVTETEYTLSLPNAVSWKWNVYDVSGIHGQRTVWIPFFDDASVIIFLAPISAFDQHLPENPTINRLAHSLNLWASICSNKLLRRARLVLFLNKIDLFKKKLDDGVCVRKYITSFASRPNDFLTAASYFRAQFERVQQRKDVVRPPNRRRLFVHFTSMLDTKAMVTQCIVSQVKDTISKKYASQMSMPLV